MRDRKHGYPPRLGASLALAVALAIGSVGPAGCATDDNGLPADCVYSADYACWACGGVPFEDVYRTYHVACRAVGDCQGFCGPAPAGWRGCDDPNNPCAMLNYPGRGLPRGTLAGCGSGTPAGPDYFHLPTYQCFFCFSSKQMTTAVLTPSGACHWFADLCLPAEYALLPRVSYGDIPTRCNNAILPDAGGADMPHDAAVPRDSGAQ